MLTAMVSLRFVARRWQRPRLPWLLVILTTIDLGVIGWTIDVPAKRTTPAYLLMPRASAGWMNTVRDSQHRLWVVTGRQGYTPGEYSDPINKVVANTNMLRKIATLSDYGPFQPRAVVRRFCFQPWGESWNTQALLADTRWTRLCDVGWILLCDDRWLPPTDCDLFTTTPEGWRLYQCPNASGHACLESANEPAAVRYQQDSPSAFTTWVDTWPAPPTASDAKSTADWPRLVVAQLALPGWTAQLDGQRLPVETLDDLLMGVRVPPGQVAEIKWSYYPPGLRVGAAISLFSAVLLAATTIVSRRASRRRAASRGAHAGTRAI